MLPPIFLLLKLSPLFLCLCAPWLQPSAHRGLTRAPLQALFLNLPVSRASVFTFQFLQLSLANLACSIMDECTPPVHGTCPPLPEHTRYSGTSISEDLFLSFQILSYISITRVKLLFPLPQHTLLPSDKQPGTPKYLPLRFQVSSCIKGVSDATHMVPPSLPRAEHTHVTQLSAFAGLEGKMSSLGIELFVGWL